MHTEEFILIPKRMFASHQLVKKKFWTISFINRKLHSCLFCKKNQLNSIEKPEKAVEPVETADKMIETAEEEKREHMTEDSENEPVVKNKKSKVFDSILLELDFMNKKQIKRSKIRLDLINESETVTVESNDVLHVNKETLGIKAQYFCTICSNQLKKLTLQSTQNF